MIETVYDMCMVYSVSASQAKGTAAHRIRSNDTHTERRPQRPNELAIIRDGEAQANGTKRLSDALSLSKLGSKLEIETKMQQIHKSRSNSVLLILKIKK